MFVTRNVCNSNGVFAKTSVIVLNPNQIGEEGGEAKLANNF